MKQSTEEWLRSAKEDLIVIKSVIKNELTTSAASFHAQQCVEKSLKAILEENGAKIPKIHDLEKLFSMIKSYVAISFNEKTVDKLNTLYIESRYPGAFGLLPYGRPALEDVKEFYSFAKNILESVKAHLEKRDEI